VANIIDELVHLCGRVRDAVLLSFGRHAARHHFGAAVGGDVTFSIDEDAEAFLGAYMAERAPSWAYYSEDRGLRGPDDPELILIVDPIDVQLACIASGKAALVEVVQRGSRSLRA
jgi:fructose-1,6-bisphosphatase/inositol monophosphatase family enzyme